MSYKSIDRGDNSATIAAKLIRAAPANAIEEEPRFANHPSSDALIVCVLAFLAKAKGPQSAREVQAAILKGIRRADGARQTLRKLAHRGLILYGEAREFGLSGLGNFAEITTAGRDALKLIPATAGAQSAETCEAIDYANDVGTYLIAASRRKGVGGMHCLEATVIATQGVPRRNGIRHVELVVRVLGASNVLVELCDARGGAQLDGDAIHAAVGEPFELFFRLSGATDARVCVELGETNFNASVRSCVLDEQFAVNATPRRTVAPAAILESPVPVPEWLLQFAEESVRQLFGHLAAHGVVTESEATNMLGGHRELRRFAREFEKFAAMCPFGVRIETISGVKRYVREGAT